jgi:hypothetical protein
MSKEHRIYKMNEHTHTQSEERINKLGKRYKEVYFFIWDTESIEWEILTTLILNSWGQRREYGRGNIWRGSD